MISIIGSPAQFSQQLLGGVSGQPGNNGSYAPGLTADNTYCSFMSIFSKLSGFVRGVCLSAYDGSLMI